LKPFHILNTPLSRTNLIEASAGTGKTYTIEGLFVRLILEQRLLVDQILVVTFTKAATEELRDRIRRKLSSTKEAFAAGSSQDPLIEALLNNYDDHHAQQAAVHDALINFDKAAIFTIHGFCQRLLYENAFETGNLFDTELITDQKDLVQELADDYWRINFYQAPLEFITYIADKLNGPSGLSRLLHYLRSSEIKIIPNIEQPALRKLKPYRKALMRLQRNWRNSRDMVMQVLKDEALDGRLYGSLKSPRNGSQLTPRDLKILALTHAMDHLTDNPGCGFPLFKGFEKFTAAYLAKAVKKDQMPPQHDFFNHCQQLHEIAGVLEQEMEHNLLFLKTQLFDFARSELFKRKARKNAYYFDDLLLIAKTALQSDRGKHLAEAIRNKYKAALVDEFQDTDDTQYEIFSRLFSTKDNLLFFIGDPKQAIYGFRGADIFSYLKAAENVASRYTLTTNWRSSPDLIAATNTIFTNVKLPFAFKEIPFERVKPGITSTAKEETTEAAITLWYLNSGKREGKQKAMNKTEAVQMIAAAAAEEICRLISPDEDNIPRQDIAVLVRTNRQARIIRDCLLAKNIPAVLFTTENIFDSREALELQKALISISEPGNLAYLKAALVMDLLGTDGHGIANADQTYAGWDMRLSNMREYHHIWNAYGFIRMFRLFIDREAIKKRLLSYPDGDRRLTNLLHLAEIIHRVSLEKNLGINGVLKWLAEQRDPSSPRLEEHQLRLESDAHAVKIVTIHKSKGLEYPIVFCPFSWESALPRSKEILFHDLDNDRRLTLDLGSEAHRNHMICAKNERLAENLRLLYVAITRAKKRCYLAWGRINTAETSAMAYLFHPSGQSQAYGSKDDIVGTLKESFSSKTESEILSDLKKLEARSRGCIQVVPLPRPSDLRHRSSAEGSSKLSSRKFAGKIDHNWKISSYSSLLSARPMDIDFPDYDSVSQITGPFSKSLSDFSHPIARHNFDDINAFPKGARAGIFFHDIYEHIDFKNAVEDHIRQVVIQKLREYGFDHRWRQTVCSTIRKTITTPLLSHQEGFALSAISSADRINEMEFHFPLKKVSPEVLQNIFQGNDALGVPDSYADQLEKLVFSPATGFMKGYMDMVFQHKGKFYLVDWKSNHLGSRSEHYTREALQNTMVENFYILQYHLYTLALYQYLRLRNPHFNYESGFGGIFYIFIRGVESIRKTTRGIYADRPSSDLVNALGAALITGF